jgi:hypothetical protein
MVNVLLGTLGETMAALALLPIDFSRRGKAENRAMVFPAKLRNLLLE